MGKYTQGRKMSCNGKEKMGKAGAGVALGGSIIVLLLVIVSMASPWQDCYGSSYGIYDDEMDNAEGNGVDVARAFLAISFLVAFLGIVLSAVGLCKGRMLAICATFCLLGAFVTCIIAQWHYVAELPNGYSDDCYGLGMGAAGWAGWLSLVFFIVSLSVASACCGCCGSNDGPKAVAAN